MELSLAQQAKEQRRLHRQHLAMDLLAGFITSSVYATATYPLHRVKILLQTQDANPRIIAGTVHRYSFGVASFQRLIREQGLLSLWRGNSAYLMRHVPSISMSFAFKDLFRAKLPSYDPKCHPWRALGVNALAGGAAGALALAAVYPFEFATVRMAADVGMGAERQYGRGVLQAWKMAVQRDGVLSLYRGSGVACFSMMAYKSLYFGLYDTAKPIVFRSYDSDSSSSCSNSSSSSSSSSGGSSSNSNGGSSSSGGSISSSSNDDDSGAPGATPDQPPILAKLLLASLTTCIAATITYPLDIIRKRLVVDVAADIKQYGAGSFLAAARTIWQREGVRGFYRFYSYDMVFRLGGGVLLVGYDILREGHGPVPPIAHTAHKVMQAPPPLPDQQEQDEAEQQYQQQSQQPDGEKQDRQQYAQQEKQQQQQQLQQHHLQR